MESQQKKRLNALGLSVLIVWLFVGPYLCFMLVDSLLTTKPLGSFWFYSPAWVAAGLAGTALFFLPLSLWQRIGMFVLYVAVVGFILPFAGFYSISEAPRLLRSHPALNLPCRASSVAVVEQFC
jgi:hypothetical protein